MSQLPATGITKTHDAFDADRPLMLRCACGQDHAPQAHDMAVQSQEDKSRDFMEAALVKALFPVDSVRRGFLKAVGVNTARAAIASVLPMGALQAMAQERGPWKRRISRSASLPSPAPAR
jgi:nitrate/nitrite transport system substrate-binding protein